MVSALFGKIIKELFACTGAHGGRKQIEFEKQVLMFLKFLAHKDTFRMNAYMFNVSISSFKRSVVRILNIVLQRLWPKYVQWPDKHRQKEISDFYYLLNGFPGVIGSLDGTKIPIKRPRRYDNDYYNGREKQHTISVQAVALPNLTFSWFDVGCPGRIHDARAFKLSDLNYQTGDVKSARFSSNDYHLLADAAYPGRSYLMMPFVNLGNLTPRQKNYNKKQAGIRVDVERAFARLKGRFKRLSYIDTKEPSTAKWIVCATMAMHNFGILKNDLWDIEDAPISDPNLVEDIPELLEVDGEGERKRLFIMNALPMPKKNSSVRACIFAFS